MKNIAIPSILLVGLSVAHSQTQPTSRIEGNISDTSGARIPNAAVSLESKGLVVLRTSADKDGHFVITVDPGDYALKIESPGFAVGVKQGIHLADAPSITENIVLQVGNGGCGVCVTPIPQIETLDASLTATLPLNPLPPLKLHHRN